jgi:hypothetical protein
MDAALLRRKRLPDNQASGSIPFVFEDTPPNQLRIVLIGFRPTGLNNLGVTLRPCKLQ